MDDLLIRTRKAMHHLSERLGYGIVESRYNVKDKPHPIKYLHRSSQRAGQYLDSILSAIGRHVLKDERKHIEENIPADKLQEVHDKAQEALSGDLEYAVRTYLDDVLRQGTTRIDSKSEVLKPLRMVAETIRAFHEFLANYTYNLYLK